MVVSKIKGKMKQKRFYGVVANVLACDIVVNEFEYGWCNYFQFHTNTLEKGMNYLMAHSYVLL